MPDLQYMVVFCFYNTFPDGTFCGMKFDILSHC